MKVFLLPISLLAIIYFVSHLSLCLSTSIETTYLTKKHYDNIWVLKGGSPINGKGKCIGYDTWGDLYLYGCTGRAEQKFTLDTGGKIVSQGGAKALQCLLADGGFWPKFRPCDDTNPNQKWEYKDGEFVTARGKKCLKHDPSWSSNRLKVEDCNNKKHDRIWLWNGSPINGKGKCIGYDTWGDLYLYGCTGRAEQKFTLDTGGKIVSQGGAKALQCLLADGGFWPKFRPCDDTNPNQKWEYKGGKFVTARGKKCLTYDPSWSSNRLKVEDCNNDKFEDSIWLSN